MAQELTYQSGFGNAFASEALPGALPRHQNSPNEVPYGLYAEQINGTGFTVRRASNQRVWLYRVRPRPLAVPFERWTKKGFTGRFDAGVVTPELLRFAPTAWPDAPTDFVDGLTTFGGVGDPTLRHGVAMHLYAATADMQDRVFSDADGDLLVVPQEGALDIRTELGWLHVEPAEIVIVPRGLRFAVALPDGRSRGFVSELYNGHMQLPERGVLGANGLADERHFHAPVASFDDRTTPTQVVVKQGGDLWRAVVSHAPFDVVAWHGNYVPFKYDLMDFVAYWSATVDHSDPSVNTVLTCPYDEHGRSALDFAVFRGRWDTTEHTFRPPFFHRNSAVEFNAVIKNNKSASSYQPGVYTYSPYLAPHGPSAAGYDRELGRAKREGDVPVRLSDDSLWVQWESCYQWRVMPWMLDHPGRDGAFAGLFQGFEPAHLG